MTGRTAMSKRSIRSRMPTVAAIFDEYAAKFPGTKLLYGSENGEVIDAREPVNPDSVWVIPPDFKPYIPKEKK